MPRVLEKTKRKAPRFIKTYIDSNFNAAEAARQHFDIDMTKKNADLTASQVGNEYLEKPFVKQTLKEMLEEGALDNKEIKRILHRNAKQNKNLPASNAAIDMTLKVKGEYAPEKRMVAYKDMTDKELDDKINEVLNEIKRLKDA